MNPDTGAIAHFETQEDADAVGHTLNLTPEQAGKLLKMSRQVRTRWASLVTRTSVLQASVSDDTEHGDRTEAQVLGSNELERTCRHWALNQAIGLLTTIGSSDMEIDVLSPMLMAEQIVEHVVTVRGTLQAEVERLGNELADARNDLRFQESDRVRTVGIRDAEIASLRAAALGLLKRAERSVAQDAAYFDSSCHGHEPYNPRITLDAIRAFLSKHSEVTRNG